VPQNVQYLDNPETVIDPRDDSVAIVAYVEHNALPRRICFRPLAPHILSQTLRHPPVRGSQHNHHQTATVYLSRSGAKNYVLILRTIGQWFPFLRSNWSGF
jgi:hypothetical protein